MQKKSAGILIYRLVNTTPEVLLVHPGGPFWAKKDLGSWSIPKGEFDDTEDPLAAAKREVTEETGIMLKGAFIELTPVKQKAGKTVYAWANEGDNNIENIKSNTFEIEWPPKSGKRRSFPEIDRAAWFTLEEAGEKILPAQVPFLDEWRDKITWFSPDTPI